MARPATPRRAAVLLGAVTLAVGMAFILTDAFGQVGLSFSGVMKHWYPRLQMANGQIPMANPGAPGT